MLLCPVCRMKLTSITEAGVHAAACAECRGTWISAAALGRRARNESTPGERHTPLAPTAALAKEAARANSTMPLVCPTCAQTMVKENFRADIPVQIDRCETCGYVWLDAGELGLLLRLYRERAARQAMAIPADRQAQLERLDTWSTAPAPASERIGPTEVNMGAAVINVLTDVLMWPSYGRV